MSVVGTHGVIPIPVRVQANHIISLLESCLKNTYFVFKGRYYEQFEGAAIGSPIGPIVANLYMEDFEGLNTSPHPPSLWKRYVDDTFIFIKSAHKEEFLDHITSIDKGIQFTAKNIKSGSSMPFLDTMVIP